MTVRKLLETGFRDCLIARAAEWLNRNLANYYAHSALGRMNAAIGRTYASSNLKRGFDRWVDRESGVDTSLYGKFLHALHTAARRFGSWFLPILLFSFLYRAATAVKGFFSRIFSGSALHRLLSAAHIDFRRFLLVIFSLYLPVDWLLRDILQISALASVWDELFFIGSVFYIIRLRISEKDWDGRTHGSPLDLPILLFAGLGLFLMLVKAPRPDIALAGYRATVQYLFWFFVVLRLIRNRGDVLTVCLGIACVGLGMALHGIVQYILAVPIPATWTTSTESAVRTRAFSITGSPNILGSYMVMTAPLFAGFAYYCKKPLLKILAWAAVLLEMFCLLATYSKGAWVGMVCAVLLFALLYDRRLFIVIAIALPVVLMLPSILNRILYLFTDDFAAASAAGGRTLRWGIGLELLKDNPLLGFGLGRFGGAVAMQNQYLDMDYFYMDNYYLKTAVEMGYPGLYTFIFMIVSLLWQGTRTFVRLRKTSVSPIAAAIISGLFGVAVHCIFENIFEEPYMMALFWGLAAALMALPRIIPRTSPAKQK